MPRITNDNTEYTPKPVGILETEIIDVDLHVGDYSELPNMKFIQDKSNDAVLELMCIPQGHDRAQPIYVPVKLAYREGELWLNDSRGVREIHTLLDGLGLDKAGFQSDGSFVDEEDSLIQFNDIGLFLTKAVINSSKFRILVHVYKEKSSNGNKYFRLSRFFYPNTENGRKACENMATKELEYQANRESSMSQQPTQSAPEQGRRRVI